MASDELSMTESQNLQRVVDWPGWKSRGAPQLGQRRVRSGLESGMAGSFGQTKRPMGNVETDTGKL